MWWILRRNTRHRHHHQRPTLWLSVNNFSIELTHNQEIEMAQTLHVDQIDNLSIAALDARGLSLTQAHADGLYEDEIVPVDGKTAENGIKGDTSMDKVCDLCGCG